MKRILPVVEAGPNYVFHLMAVARNGFDSDYADRYAGTVSAGDLALLQANRQRLSFRDGRTGDLAETLVFLPAYLGLNSPGDLAVFFDLLIGDLEAGEPAGQLNRYGDKLAALFNWVSPLDFAARHRWLAGSRELISRLGEAYVRNFAAYLADVWPVEKPLLQDVAGRLSEHFAERDTIAGWEKLTGRLFKSGRYEIVLCSAIKGGPNANSLGYDRNVFYHGSDFAFLTQFISHETGTHILIDLVKELFTGGEGPGYPFALVYQGYESLCKFYNSILLGEPATYSLYSSDPRWQAVFAGVYAADPEVTPEELFRAGLAKAAKTAYPTG